RTGATTGAATAAATAPGAAAAATAARRDDRARIGVDVIGAVARQRVLLRDLVHVDGALDGVLSDALAEEQDLHVGRPAVAVDAARVLVDDLQRRRIEGREPLVDAVLALRRVGAGAGARAAGRRSSRRCRRWRGYRARWAARPPARRRSAPGRPTATPLHACRSGCRRGRRPR